MTIRVMGDTTGPNADKLPHGLALVMGYDTGGPDIKWTDADWALYPDIPHVHVDQAGEGSPVHTATVMDVEPGAYQPGQVPDWVHACTAERPTVYCDRDDLPAVLETGWRGDLILAIPEPEPTMPPVVAGCTVVAVQFKFRNSPPYDLSAVFDPDWPSLPRGSKRIIASGIHTVGEIARREGLTVPELILHTFRHGDDSYDLRRLLDDLGSRHPIPGTVFYI
jgi:hypothetical protein